MVGMIWVLALLAVMVVRPVGASTHLYQETPPPPTRPTAEPVAYLELEPVQGVAGNATPVRARGGLWEAGHTVMLYWDDVNVPPGVLLGSAQIRGDGTFQIDFQTPTDDEHATVGVHQVIAVATNGDRATAGFELIQGTPTLPPPPTPEPFITLNPTQDVAGKKLSIVVNGTYWPVGGPGVTLAWDQFDEAHWLLGPFAVNPDGTFQVTVQVKAAWATVGTHKVIAWDNVGFYAEATIVLTEPPPTTPPTPTATSSSTPTLTPSPTLRPVTPMVTITPIPPTKPPSVTKPPSPTRTNTPVPGTPTSTYTPSVTPTPSDTPGPGTPAATPEPSATPVEEISDTGSGWGTIFLWGFVLAALLMVFRLLRVRSLREQG
jgi:hypothetical protein